MFFIPSYEVLYRDIADAKQLCAEFRFDMEVAPGYKGEAGFISFDEGGRVTVKPGYVWDGASGPTIDTLSSVRAALGHDVMYELMRCALLPSYVFKPVADRWFYEHLLEDGMIQYRAYAWWRAVEAFGADACDPRNMPQIKRAPIPFPREAIRMIEPIPGYPIRALGA